MTRAREDVRQLGAGESTNAGLWLDRCYSSDADDPAAKFNHIKALQNLQTPAGYGGALRRRDALLRPAGRSIDVQVPDKIVAGLGFKGVFEAGLALEHTWGTPVIAGSSLKGATRALARDLADVNWSDGGRYSNALFGTVDGRGGVSFHDAWWVPEGRLTLPLEADILTVHHRAYYGDADHSSETDAESRAERPEPDGTDSPVPIPFVVVARTTFRIWFTGEEPWVEVAMKILLLALQRGIGAKTDGGYGRMKQR